MRSEELRMMKDSKKLQYSTLFKALWLGQSFPTKSHHSPPYPNQTASFRVDWRVSLLVLSYRTLAFVMVVPYPLGLSEVYGTIHRLWICFDHSHSSGCVVVPFPLQRNCSEAMNYHHLWVLQRERVSTRRNAEVRQAYNWRTSRWKSDNLNQFGAIQRQIWIFWSLASFG